MFPADLGLLIFLAPEKKTRQCLVWLFSQFSDKLRFCALSCFARWTTIEQSSFGIRVWAWFGAGVRFKVELGGESFKCQYLAVLYFSKTFFLFLIYFPNSFWSCALLSGWRGRTLSMCWTSEPERLRMVHRWERSFLKDNTNGTTTTTPQSGRDQQIRLGVKITSVSCVRLFPQTSRLTDARGLSCSTQNLARRGSLGGSS